MKGRPVSPAVSGIAHTGITVTDLHRSLLFWRDALGFTEEFHDHLEGKFVETVSGVDRAIVDVVMLKSPDGQRIELVQYSSPPERDEVRPRPCDVGSLHVALFVDDIDAVCESVAALDWAPANPPQTVPEGPLAGTRVAYLFGP
ncbi:MAG: hypothetical protein QOF73_245, partial [Thermomicrobiales bacterium]|nr:hypothetical protein [Thermomicrobiales bacterium]